MARKRKRGTDWYTINGRILKIEEPGLIDWSSAANRFRVVAAVGLVVIGIFTAMHMMFIAWDKQCAIDEERNAQQWSDFYAAQ